MKRVVVTGVGPISSIGVGKDRFWESAKNGQGYFRTVNFGSNDVDMDQYKCRICSPVDNFDPVDYVENVKKLKRASRATIFTIVGVLLALDDAGFIFDVPSPKKSYDSHLYPVKGVDPLRCGVIIGQSVSNSDVMIPQHTTFVKNRGPKKLFPSALPESNINVGASSAAEWFRLRGTNFTLATACTSATHAIGMAALNIKNGIDDMIVTGGAEATEEPYLFSGFDVIRSLSKRNEEPMKASRPFDRDRDGFVLGEGAGIIVLEELGHAQKRNARIYAELIGFGYSADGYNIVAPDPFGRSAINALKKALAMGNVSPEEVEYINAHGTSTVINDPNESYIVKQVFGDYAYKIPISSSKSYFGHPLGAAGGLESIVTLLTIFNNTIPPTNNLENPDVNYTDSNFPDLDKRCDLDYVPEGMREKPVHIAVNESFGFGGQNGVLLFKKFEQ
jgi:3-oxoacyl-[acyl-carrier-protein] synthase II